MKSHDLPNEPISSPKFSPTSPQPRLLPPIGLSSYNLLTVPNFLAWGFILLYIVTFTWLAILRHASFNSSGFDLGIYDQVVWNTLHGRPFFYTTTGQPLLHLSNHASPILLLVAPFYLLYSGPEMLLFLQTAAIGLGALPLFWLAREKLTAGLSALSHSANCQFVGFSSSGAGRWLFYGRLLLFGQAQIGLVFVFRHPGYAL
jgi:hypothetical protein